VGEIVDLEKYRKKIEEAENKEIHEDISRLKAEIDEIIYDMESPWADQVYYSEYIDMLPHLSTLSTTLDGYSWLGNDDGGFQIDGIDYVITQPGEEE
jgi:hypothetical protein